MPIGTESQQWVDEIARTNRHSVQLQLRWHIHGTDRGFPQGIEEYTPGWSLKQMTCPSPKLKAISKNPFFTLAKLLAAFGHQMDHCQSFQMIQRNRNPRFGIFEKLSINILNQLPGVQNLSIHIVLIKTSANRLSQNLFLSFSTSFVIHYYAARLSLMWAKLFYLHD